MTGPLEISSICGTLGYKPVMRVARGSAVKPPQTGKAVVRTVELVKLKGRGVPGLLSGWGLAVTP